MTDTPLKPEPVAWMRPQARSMILSNWMDGRKPYVAVLEAERTQDNTVAIFTQDQLDAAVRAERELVDFCIRWAWRNSPITDTERLSVIKYHPTLKRRAIGQGYAAAIREGQP